MVMLSRCFFSSFVAILFTLTSVVSIAYAAPETQPQQSIPLTWVDYTRTTSPFVVTPMDLITETLSVKLVEPTGPRRFWHLFREDTSQAEMQKAAQIMDLFDRAYTGWEAAAYYYVDESVNLLCERSDIATFSACMRNTLPLASRTGEANMAGGLDKLVGEIYPAQVVPSPNIYDGVDYVVLHGSFDANDIVESTTIKTCFKAPEKLGVSIHADRLFCSAMWLQTRHRIGLITMCQDGLPCSEQRMSLPGYRHIVRETNPEDAARDLTEAIYPSGVPQHSWVTAHVLAAYVVPESIPSNCTLNNADITCSIGFSTEFELSYQARPRPMNFGLWSPPPPWTITAMWQINQNAPLPNCIGDTVRYAMSYVAFPSDIHQVFLPFVNNNYICPSGCNVAVDNINDVMCPQRPAGSYNY